MPTVKSANSIQYFISEPESKAKPTKKDYKYTKLLFQDFGIKTENLEIPEFNTNAELQRYTNSP